MRNRVPAGMTVQEMIAAWKPEVLSSTVAARVNQTPVDLSHALQADGAIDP